MLARFSFSIELESDSNSNSSIRHRAQSSIKPEPRVRVELSLIEFEQFGFGTYLPTDIGYIFSHESCMRVQPDQPMNESKGLELYSL